jgi:hypothetical protein
MFNEDRAFFIMDLCFPSEVRTPELQADLELAQALAEDWPEWSDVARAWIHHFGKERMVDAVACAFRVEETVFLGKRIEELDVEQFGYEESCEEYLVTQGVAHTWHAIARVDHKYLDRSVKTLEIAERCVRCGMDACWCARQWITLPLEDGLSRAIASMDHAEAFYFSDVAVPANSDAHAEQLRQGCLKEDYERICREWLRSFGADLGARCLRHFQERAGPGSTSED